MLFDLPCERCEQMESPCHEQAAGTGRGACFQCGKAKVRCSKSLLEQDAVPVGENMPMRRPTKKTKIAVRATSVESEEQTDAPPKRRRRPVRLPKSSSSSASDTPVADSPPRLSAKDKGKGRGMFQMISPSSNLMLIYSDHVSREQTSQRHPRRRSHGRRT